MIQCSLPWSGSCTQGCGVQEMYLKTMISSRISWDAVPSKWGYGTFQTYWKWGWKHAQHACKVTYGDFWFECDVGILIVRMFIVHHLLCYHVIVNFLEPKNHSWNIISETFESSHSSWHLKLSSPKLAKFVTTVVVKVDGEPSQSPLPERWQGKL